jgi:O-methyltransferase
MRPVRQAVKKVIRAAGFEVARSGPSIPLPKNYSFETDETFKSVFRQGVIASGSPHDPDVVHQRMYNATQFLKYSLDLPGDVVECGSFKGLSSFVFCNYIRMATPDFTGGGYHIFDSFQGLSQPTKEDLIANHEYGAVGETSQPGGAFEGSIEAVKTTLRDFPLIEYHPGWIPESFAGVPKRNYKFVHLDLDLYEPIKSAVEYFYPRMVQGGVIVIDEYGFPRWPGAQRAVDEFCTRNGLSGPISLTTGNGVLIKK